MSVEALHQGDNNHTQSTGQDDTGGVKGRAGVLIIAVGSSGRLAGAGGADFGGGREGGRRGRGRSRRLDSGGGCQVRSDGVHLRKGQGLGEGRGSGTGGGGRVLGESKRREDGEDGVGEPHGDGGEMDFQE